MRAQPMGIRTKELRNFSAKKPFTTSQVNQTFRDTAPPAVMTYPSTRSGTIAAWVRTHAMMVLAIAVGIGLRLYQLPGQILIDDEWHSVHKLLQAGYGDIATHFGFADY